MDNNLENTIKSWCEEHCIPFSLLEKEKISFTENEETGDIYLEIPVFNKRGKSNVFYVNIFKTNDFYSQEENDDYLGNFKNDNKHLFITENPLDRLYLTYLNENSINVPLHDLDKHFLETLEKNHPKCEKFYISVSPEKENDLIKIIPNHKISIVNLNEYGADNLFELFKINDKKDISLEYIKSNLIKNSKPVPIKGVFSLEDFESKTDSIFANGLKLGEKTGWDSLDIHFRPKTKNVTVIHGIPEHGKSSFAKCLCINLAKKAKWKSGFFSFEDDDGESFYHELIEKTLGKITPFYKTTQRTKDVLKEKDYIEAKKFINEYIKFIVPELSSDENELDNLLKIFEQAIQVYGLKNIVIDPWNQIVNNKPNNMNEGDFLSICLGKISRFAKKHDVHVFIVAHPKIMSKDLDGEYKLPTLYDISGGANWFNKVSVGICVYRQITQTETGLNRISHIIVQKCKRRELGKIGRVFLAMLEGSETLLDVIDQQKYKQHITSKKNEKVVLANFIKSSILNKIMDKETKATQISSLTEANELEQQIQFYQDFKDKSVDETKNKKSKIDNFDPYNQDPDLPF